MRQTLFAGALAIALTGCQQPSGSAAMRQEIDKLAAKVAELDSEVSSLTLKLAMQSLSGPQEAAVFDPQESPGYAAIYAPAGPVLATLERLDPYLDGFTVYMRLGNPTSATYSGIQGTVKWGRKYDQSQSKQHNQLQEKAIDLKDALPAGAWTIVKFNIGPAKPEEVRRVVFAPKFDHVRLRDASR